MISRTKTAAPDGEAKPPVISRVDRGAPRREEGQAPMGLDELAKFERSRSQPTSPKISRAPRNEGGRFDDPVPSARPAENAARVEPLPPVQFVRAPPRRPRKPQEIPEPLDLPVPLTFSDDRGSTFDKRPKGRRRVRSDDDGDEGGIGMRSGAPFEAPDVDADEDFAGQASLDDKLPDVEDMMGLEDEPRRRPKLKERDMAKNALRGRGQAARPLPVITKETDESIVPRLQTKSRRAVPSAGRGKGAFDAKEWVMAAAKAPLADTIQSLSLSEILRRNSPPKTDRAGERRMRRERKERTEPAGDKTPGEVDESLPPMPRMMRSTKKDTKKFTPRVRTGSQDKDSSGKSALDRRMEAMEDTSQVDLEGITDEKERWRLTVSFLLDKIIDEEAAGVALMTKQRRHATKYRKAYHAKRRKEFKEKNPDAPPRTAPLQLPAVSSWSGVSLYPGLEQVPESGPMREQVRAILGNSGWTIGQRSRMAAMLIETVADFQENGIFSKEEDKEIESVLDEV